MLSEKFFYVWFAFVGMIALGGICGIAYAAYRVLVYFGIM